MRVTELGRRRLDSAEMAQIEYIGNEKEIKEQEAERKTELARTIPTFWEFSRNIAKDEVEYYKKAIQVMREKLAAATSPANKKAKFGKYTAQEYAENCRKSISLLEANLEKTRKDLKLLEQNKGKQMFKNCDAKYATSVSSLV